METINGEWIMKGCAPDDPRRLRTAADAARLIREIGILPLFSNEIAGFSVEERTTAGSWWDGDEASDPWEWRQALSREEDILYGKFYDRKACFVSAEWFPVLANWRRRGYDFDALFDEGRAPFRARKLMEPFLTEGMPNDAALLSSVLKEQAGFGKGGEKNFEGVLTDLQMQTYLIVGDFRQRLNKLGKPYGWHLSVVQTPEARLGYDAFAAAYRETPADAGRRLEKQLRRFFPGVTDAQLRTVLGGRVPGAD